MSSQSNQLHSFDLADVDAAIAGTEFHGWLMNFPTVPSTNSLAAEAARAGARHGVWIADQQTAGRGRGSHTWHSAPGEGLYMTALISPPVPLQSTLRLSLSTAIAVQSAIASTFGFRIREEIDIRWPNDLMLNGRKCGGVLIETASEPALPPQPPMLRYAIIGIGINLYHTAFPPELDSIATSIRRELPSHLALGSDSFARSVENGTKCLRREPIAAAILIALDAEIRRLSTHNLSLYSTWVQGKRVRVEDRDGLPGYTGTTAGLDPNGFLLVDGDDGQRHTVLSGGLRDP